VIFFENFDPLSLSELTTRCKTSTTRFTRSSIVPNSVVALIPADFRTILWSCKSRSDKGRKRFRLVVVVGVVVVLTDVLGNVLPSDPYSFGENQNNVQSKMTIIDF